MIVVMVLKMGYANKLFFDHIDKNLSILFLFVYFKDN